MYYHHGVIIIITPWLSRQWTASVMPPLPLLHWNIVFAWSVATSVRSVSHPVPNIIFLLRNTERISMKFTAGNSYHEEIKLLHFWWNCMNKNKGAGYDKKIRINVNRFCRDVKQLLTPSELIQKLQTTADATADRVFHVNVKLISLTNFTSIH